MNNFNSFTNEELAKAIELMVSPSDLVIREVAVAILQTFDYSTEEVAEQLQSGKYFNSGATFRGLNTSQPVIINQAL